MTSIGEIIAAHTRAAAWAKKSRRTAGLPSAWPKPARRRVSQPSLGVGMGGRQRSARRQRDGHGGENGRADPQPGADAEGGDDESAERRADREAHREGDVEQRVAGLELAVGLQRRGHGGAGQRAPDQGEDAVDRGQHEDRAAAREPTRPAAPAPRRSRPRRRRGRAARAARRRDPGAPSRRGRRARGPAGVQSHRAVVASALWVWSKTSRPSATVPKPQPSSLSVYEAARRRKAAWRRGRERDHRDGYRSRAHLP